jgi:hypothetical protein
VWPLDGGHARRCVQVAGDRVVAELAQRVMRAAQQLAVAASKTAWPRLLS